MAAAVTSGEVSWVLITSTSFITVAGLKKCMPSTCSGRDVPMATSMMGMDDVLVAMIADGSSTRSSTPKISSLSASLSGTASSTRSQPARSPRSVVQATAAAAASRVASSSLPRATPRSIDFSTRPRPASTSSGVASRATTARPLRAATSTTPLPMVPTPITPTVPIRLIGRSCCAAARGLDGTQSDSVIVTELMVTSV